MHLKFIIFIALQFFYINASQDATCNCFSQYNPKYRKVKESYTDYTSFIRKLLFTQVSNGYGRYDWEKKYLSAHSDLLVNYIYHPRWFSDYYNNLLIDDKIVEICKEYKLENCLIDFKETTDPKYVAKVDNIYMDASKCHEAYYACYGNILNIFDEIYKDCIANHQVVQVYYDYGLLKHMKGEHAESMDLLSKTIEFAQKSGETEILSAETFRNLGISCLEAMSYEKAVEALTEAINKDPKNKNNYFQRASAYFELGNFDLAIEDFLKSDKTNYSGSRISFEFTRALLIGLVSSGKDAAFETIPSLLSTASGLNRTLWAHFKNPLKSTGQFAEACYEAGKYTVNFYKELDWDKVEDIAEEVKALCKQFEQLNDTEKGHLIGSIIGKYGVDIFVSGVALKGVSVYNKLKDANRICNFEALTSKVHKQSVIAAAVKHAKDRKKFFKAVQYNFDDHYKHVVGHKQYIEGRSIFVHQDPQGLLKRFAGKGKPQRGTAGLPGYKESVDFKEHIGIWKNKDNTLALPTTRGTIHYGKKGAHIVPSDPNVAI